LCMFGMVTEDDDGASASYTLETLLKELCSATNLDDLTNVRDDHASKGLLYNKFWAKIYQPIHEKMYNALLGMHQQSKGTL